MKFLRRNTFLFLSCVALLVAKNSFAIPAIKKNSKEQAAPAVLKADQVEGNQVDNTLTASGNVEVAKGNGKVYADKVVYEKSKGVVHATGNVKATDVEVGNVRATQADIKDDFSSGEFLDSKMFFADGSYLTSPKIERKDPLTTVLTRPIFSVCPNPEISADNEVAGKEPDLFSIKTKQTTIDRTDEVMRSKSTVMRLYDVPFFYTPYLSVALPSKKKKSGFLTPSYAKSTNLGVGVRVPYYFYIAPNLDITTSPLIGISNNQILIENELRHKASYGEYKLNFEGANNKINNTSNTTVVKRTSQQYRWNLAGEGKFDFTNDVGADFKSNIVSDRNYLRDYHFNYLNYSLSQGNVDYIHGRDYHSVKLIKIQELENDDAQKSEPTIMPQIDSHIESKPMFSKETFALTSNTAVITRTDGLQYRRATVVPEANLPFNMNGNLFNLNAKVQNDLYWLKNDNNSTSSTNNTQQYQTTQTNTKPSFALNWKLPLIKKTATNTFVIEPMANLVVSSYRKSFSLLPDEDSNNSELSISNMFLSDRIAGFDRNESGHRANVGVRTSYFNKDYGQFGLTVGQGYRKSSNTQDAIIKGFSTNNKSNFVGQALYKAKKYFSTTYTFQLNESSYSNEVNQLSTTLAFDKISFSSEYLLIRRTLQNSNKMEQLSFFTKFNVSKDWSLTLMNNQDLVLGRALMRSAIISREGCCTIFSFSVMETNPSSLTKPQKSFNINILFKNL